MGKGTYSLAYRAVPCQLAGLLEAFLGGNLDSPAFRPCSVELVSHPALTRQGVLLMADLQNWPKSSGARQFSVRLHAELSPRSHAVLLCPLQEWGLDLWVRAYEA